MEKQETIFRQKSVDRVSSPEQLDNYLKVTSPSVWIILIGIIVILIGAIVWGTFGELKTYANVGCVIDSDGAYCYVKEEELDRVQKGMLVEIPSVNESFEITSINRTGVNIPNTYDYLQHIIGVTQNDYVFQVFGECDIATGYYPGKIVVEKVSPLTFVFN